MSVLFKKGKNVVGCPSVTYHLKYACIQTLDFPFILIPIFCMHAVFFRLPSFLLLLLLMGKFQTKDVIVANNRYFACERECVNMT